MKNIVTRLELEVQELRSSSDKDNPNVFSAVTKTLARKVNNLANPVALMSSNNTTMTVTTTPATPPYTSTFPPSAADTSSDDYLEQSMKKAQEDAELMRSLVVPLEEEIKALKDKLRSTDDQLRVYENTQVCLVHHSHVLSVFSRCFSLMHCTVQAELVRGTQVMAKLLEEQSLESLMSDLSAKAADDMPEPFGLFMAIANVQRTALQEEKERLR